MNKIIVFLCLLATASILFSIAGKGIINFAPTIGWSLAILLLLAATVIALAKKKK
ncbi:hypothetical protein M5W68_01370 [Paenibacillus larvae]|uniref:hypothetical protein n=1 Tax=Paenibacillus larvae TaxID=1464 RepID=UPI00227E7599|nr:hypothetical protein [Paenibacillus larvae]MCY9508472.1 hypothetical protein [Paenibacillus larvae]MCY9523826.1 hypothetical protein [Paenibacillus larvae]